MYSVSGHWKGIWVVIKAMQCLEIAKRVIDKPVVLANSDERGKRKGLACATSNCV